MNSLQRVLTALSFKEADRVPFFFLLTTHGARELNMPIKDYFFDPEAVVEGQWRMRKRYSHDCLYAFTYAALEVEAWGGSVDFFEDGPPNAGSPIIRQPQDIDSLPVPDIASTPGLVRNLKIIRLMKERSGEEVPIIGVVMAPFSLPVMQMGFSGYLDLVHDDPTRLSRLLEINREFCIRWANAQLEAGATAICYFDPLSSTDMIPLELYRDLVFPLSCRTLKEIKGPTATHFASGRSLSLLEMTARTGTSLAGISVLDDPGEAKRICRGRLAIFGNLDGISMRRWSREDAEREVKEVLAKAAPGGGFILSDNHGELHYSIDETVLDTISEAVLSWGKYPLDWCR
jgi:uroporphyrinogen decarboxylase